MVAFRLPRGLLLDDIGMIPRIIRGIVVWDTVFVHDTEYLKDSIEQRSEWEWINPGWDSRRKKAIAIRKHTGCYWMVLE